MTSLRSRSGSLLRFRAELRFRCRLRFGYRLTGFGADSNVAVCGFGFGWVSTNLRSRIRSLLLFRADSGFDVGSGLGIDSRVSVQPSSVAVVESVLAGLRQACSLATDLSSGFGQTPAPM